MRMLDEVIKIFETFSKERSDLYEGPSQSLITDALYYLKTYRRLEMAYVKALADIEENPALSWNELKQMEGKPVWVEHLKDGVVYKAGWCLIVQVDDSLPDLPCVGLVDTDADYRNFEVEWMDMGQWQAYRKERENESTDSN